MIPFLGTYPAACGVIVLGYESSYYVGTVGQHATEAVIKQYVKNQGQEEEYVQLHVQQLKLF